MALEATIVQSGRLTMRGLGSRRRPHPTLFSMPGLTARAVWREWRPPFFDAIAAALPAIREEYAAARAALASDYSTADAGRDGGEHRLHAGAWEWRSHVIKGAVVAGGGFARAAPRTAALLDGAVGDELMLGVPFGFAFFSSLAPRSTIAAHAGATNLRLRVHVPLELPSRDARACGLRVADETLAWRDGECLVFDDQFEHEAWNHTDAERGLLLFDVWHPELSADERAAIRGMFDGARKQGWLKE